MNLSWGKRLDTECCSRKERSGTAWLPAGLWQLKGVTRNTDKGRCPSCLGEEDAVHIGLDCLETGNLRMKILNYKWLSMNKAASVV
jgi:hypothetical protein